MVSFGFLIVLTWIGVEGSSKTSSLLAEGCISGVCFSGTKAMGETLGARFAWRSSLACFFLPSASSPSSRAGGDRRGTS